MTVAALYIDPVRGPYRSMLGVDPWGLPRDAREYAGPHPVVAHPPCGHWGRFRWNCKQPESYRECGPRAVEQVRAFGGVLEHPSGSLLWRECGLPRPGRFSTLNVWEPSIEAERVWETTIEVEQVWWGHAARKRTWLYIVGVDPRSVVVPRNDNKPTRVMGVPRSKGRTLLCLPKSQRHLTPPAFAEWLIELARRCRV